MTQSIFAQEQEIIMSGLQSIALLSKLEIDYAKGVYIYDLQGKDYLDFFGGVGVCSIGHSHPHYIEAMQLQLSRSVIGSFTTKTRLNYLNLLRSTLPHVLDRIQFYSGGAEAVEAAIRLARSYTGRTEIIGFWGGYHGKSMQTLAFANKAIKNGYPPTISATYSAPYADCFHCPMGHSYSTCNLHCVHFLEQFIDENSYDNVAAVIIEPIQGTAGNIVPPPEFLPLVYEVTQKKGALLILDEMITGFGRTGHMFGMNRYDFLPDIAVFGKGIASGFPLTALVARDEITTAGAFGQPSGSSSSYGGNPLACAAGLATLEVILNEKLVENSRAIGLQMIERLICMKKKYPFIGHVQGEGLMIGVEFIDPKSNLPLSTGIMTRFFNMCLQQGLLVMAYKSRVRIYPPLCISSIDAMKGLDIFEHSIASLEQEISRH